MARSASEMIGRPSLRKMFQMPVTPTYRAMSWPPKPHDGSMLYVGPTATAPPAGRVFATDVVVCVSTADCANFSLGSAAMFNSQYVTRLNTIAAKSDHSSIGVSPEIVAQTAE